MALLLSQYHISDIVQEIFLRYGIRDIDIGVVKMREETSSVNALAQEVEL